MEQVNLKKKTTICVYKPGMEVYGLLSLKHNCVMVQ